MLSHVSDLLCSSQLSIGAYAVRSASMPRSSTHAAKSPFTGEDWATNDVAYYKTVSLQVRDGRGAVSPAALRVITALTARVPVLPFTVALLDVATKQTAPVFAPCRGLGLDD